MELLKSVSFFMCSQPIIEIWFIALNFTAWHGISKLLTIAHVLEFAIKGSGGMGKKREQKLD